MAGDLLDSASAALRELAVYYSHDRDAARSRGDSDAARYLAGKFDETHRLADELRDASPDAVAAGAWSLAEARALVDQLRVRLAAMVPNTEARRAYVRQPGQSAKIVAVPGLRAVAYLRVSTARQAEAFGLDVQEAAVRMWAQQHRARIVYTMTDAGKSGAANHVDRPGLAEALGHIEGKRADVIVVARLDRLAREQVLQEWLRAEVISAGGQLRSADSEEDRLCVADPDDPTATMVRQILGAVAQHERAMIRLRMEAGKAAKRQAGGYVAGAPPYGFRAHHHDLVPNIEEQRTVSRIKRWRREGKSLRQIADRLNSEGVPARRGRWHPQTVQRVVERQPIRRAS